MEEIVRLADTDGNGKVSFAEFKQIIKRKGEELRPRARKVKSNKKIGLFTLNFSFQQ